MVLRHGIPAVLRPSGSEDATLLTSPRKEILYLNYFEKQLSTDLRVPKPGSIARLATRNNILRGMKILRRKNKTPIT